MLQLLGKTDSALDKVNYSNNRSNSAIAGHKRRLSDSYIVSLAAVFSLVTRLKTAARETNSYIALFHYLYYKPGHI